MDWEERAKDLETKLAEAEKRLALAGERAGRADALARELDELRQSAGEAKGADYFKEEIRRISDKRDGYKHEAEQARATLEAERERFRRDLDLRDRRDKAVALLRKSGVSDKHLDYALYRIGDLGGFDPQSFEIQDGAAPEGFAKAAADFIAANPELKSLPAGAAAAGRTHGGPDWRNADGTIDHQKLNEAANATLLRLRTPG